MSSRTAVRTRERSVTLLRALDQRLGAVAAALDLISLPARGPALDPGRSASAFLPLLVEACLDAAGTDVPWLVLTGVAGAFPRSRDVLAFRRRLEVLPPHELAAALLADVVASPRHGRLDFEMDVVVGGIVVNVDFCARHDIHTGIHRVVRETLPRWQAKHAIVATANIDEYSGLRTLAPREAHRVFAYGTEPSVSTSDELDYHARLVVPWRGVLVIPEIPEPAFSPYLAALAELSGNQLNIIGYDMIPVVSADLRPDVDAVRFASYLSVIKHATRVAGISVSATTEFAGFAHAVTAQGLPGPTVREVLLPGDVPTHATPSASAAPDRRPLVLCVGSHEPHKNHRTVLHAAERLWRAGHEFDLEFIGGTGWRSEELVAYLAEVRASGRPVHDRGRVTDDELWQAYRDASFTVFLSVHEGFGLPVVESLGCGTPVVTSIYGSMGEIAAGGGCLAVDPRDDDAVTEAIRVLLTDRNVLDRLREEAARRPVRRWDQYATELWDVLAVRADQP